MGAGARYRSPAGSIGVWPIAGAEGVASAPLTWYDWPVRWQAGVRQVEKLRDNECLGVRFPVRSTSGRTGIASPTEQAPANEVGAGLLV